MYKSISDIPDEVVLQEIVKKALDKDDKDQGRMLVFLGDRKFPLEQQFAIRDQGVRERVLAGLLCQKEINVDKIAE